MQEIEIKLGFDPRHLPATDTSLTELFGSPSQRKQLKNTYFDTPAKDLRDKGWTVRIRDKDGGFEQTVKGKGVVEAGLHQRLEVNQELDSYALDTAKLSGIEEIAPFVSLLEPAFSTDFARLTWEIRHNDSLIELALDSGVIISGQSEQAISEIELELKQGKTVDIVAVGANIVAQIPCWLLSDSKAKRGHELGGVGVRSAEQVTDLFDWITHAGRSVQQMTIDSSDKVDVIGLQQLLSQLPHLLEVEREVGLNVKVPAEQLMASWQGYLQSAAVLSGESSPGLRQWLTDAKDLGVLGMAIIRSKHS